VKFDIVIAHYRENIEWLENLNNSSIRNIFVYSKGRPQILNNNKIIAKQLENIGRESHTYLTYCVEMYDNLPDFVIFLQGNPHGITVDVISKWIEELNQNFHHCTNNYKVGNIDWFLNNGKIYEWGGKTDVSSFNVWEWVDTYIDKDTPKNNINIFWNACFGVSKAAIKSNSLNKYKHIIEKELNGKNPEAAHFLERSWYYLFNIHTLQENLPKNIWIYWAQGWDNAPLLQKYVASSWKINNKNWKVRLLHDDNVKNFIKEDVPYLFDKNKNITYQAKSDIIRLAILNKYGGVWADSTLLCMQPLDHWVHEAVDPSGIWMYHSWGAGIPDNQGISSWFIISKKNSYIINKWKKSCDEYWLKRNESNIYFWMDALFNKLYYNDEKFNELWKLTPYLSSEDYGQAHCLSKKIKMDDNNHELKLFFKNSPPYVLKFWNHWNDIFPDIKDEKCRHSVGYFAILMAKRGFQYKHPFKD
jgi:hypothetical protein